MKKTWKRIIAFALTLAMALMLVACGGSGSGGGGNGPKAAKIGVVLYQDTGLDSKAVAGRKSKILANNQSAGVNIGIDERKNILISRSVVYGFFFASNLISILQGWWHYSILPFFVFNSTATKERVVVLPQDYKLINRPFRYVPDGAS